MELLPSIVKNPHYRGFERCLKASVDYCICILGFGLPQDGNVGVAVFAEGEESFLVYHGTGVEVGFAEGLVGNLRLCSKKRTLICSIFIARASCSELVRGLDCERRAWRCRTVRD